MRPLIGITTARRDSDEGQQDMFCTMAPYVEAVRRAGGLPLLVPLGFDEDELRDLFGRLDGLLLSGGGDIEPRQYGCEPIDDLRSLDADRDRVELTLARWAVEERKPMLGICRGAQTFNVALGGTLYRDIAREHPNGVKHDYYPGHPRTLLVHPVQVSEDTLLARALGAPIVQVNSLHHQAARDVAASLVPAAHSPDGVIEAVELPGHPFALGVQWHPEWLQDMPEMRGLFEAFVQATK